MIAASDSASAVQTACDDACPNDGYCNGLCDGCLIGLNSFYLSYGDYLDTLNTEIEAKYWNKLQQSFVSVSM